MKYLKCTKYKQNNLIEKFVFLFWTCLFIGIGSSLYGQYKPLDNGDIETINKKELQNENYFGFTKRGDQQSTGLSSLLRYGIQKNVELQVTWSGIRSENTSTGFSSSGQSANVGLKAFLVDDSKYLPGISLIGSINLTADPNDVPIMPALNILFKKGLTSNFTITGNYQFILNEQNGDLSSDFALNLDVELTKWLTSYVGVTGVKSFPTEDNSLYQEYLELGMLFWISDGLRIYPFYDFGLADDSDDIINIGLLYYFK